MSSSPSRTAADWPALRVIEGGLSSVLERAERQRQIREEQTKHPEDPAYGISQLASLAAEDLAIISSGTESPALSAAFDAVTGLHDSDLVMVPREPDALMIATGAAVAGVDRATAERIYRAMVRLAE
ncbi:hypothetical protein ABWI00_17985 [Algihabitans albus]|uniref:hypothetical protein n=1 Tax=Algihabitans albus TaxID=2164067 RepID=UPI0035CF7EFF